MAKRSREDNAGGEAGSGDVSSPSDIETAHTPKFASLEPPERSKRTTAMVCSLAPHKKPINFSSYSEYETHYQIAHTNRCIECHTNLPTPHFLDLHIAENHDPILAARRDRGEKTYACFVEGCDKVCLEWKKRRSHLVDKHGFPRNYDFFIVNTGIDGKRSMLRPGVDAQGHRKSSRERYRRGSSVTESTMGTEATSVSAPTDIGQEMEGVSSNKTDDMANKQAVAEVEGLATSMSALKMVPRSVTFGKRKGQSGFAKS
jgi:hypothetical protein